MRDEKCKTCGRLLNVESDELSGDCGGDCWGCIGEIEADGGYKPSIRIVMDEWRRGSRPNWTPPQLSETITLWAAIDATEFEQFASRNWQSIPPSSQDLLIFLNKNFAMTVARDLSAPRGGGWVVEFELKRSVCEDYGLDEDNAHEHRDYRVTGANAARFNEAIVGNLKVVAEFR